MFAKQLQPGGLPDAPGGGGLWGWGVSAGGGFEHYDQNAQLTYAVDAQYTVEEEVSYGMSFPAGGKELETYVKNITDTGKPFPTSDDYKKISAQHKTCRENNITALKKLLSDGTIDQNLYSQLIEKAISKGCSVDYSVEKIETNLFKALGSKATISSLKQKGIPGSQVDVNSIVEFLLTK